MGFSPFLFRSSQPLYCIAHWLVCAVTPEPTWFQGEVPCVRSGIPFTVGNARELSNPPSRWGERTSSRGVTLRSLRKERSKGNQKGFP